MVNKTNKSKQSKSKKDKSISNESDKGRSLDKSMSLDKSRSTQRIETEDTVKTLNKSMYISSASFSDKITKIEIPKEIDIRKYNPIISVISGHGVIITRESLYKKLIPRNNKRKNTLENYIKGKIKYSRNRQPK